MVALDTSVMVAMDPRVMVAMDTSVMVAMDPRVMVVFSLASSCTLNVDTVVKRVQI